MPRLFLQDELMELMADGRWRTPIAIAIELGGNASSADVHDTLTLMQMEDRESRIQSRINIRTKRTEYRIKPRT